MTKVRIAVLTLVGLACTFLVAPSAVAADSCSGAYFPEGRAVYYHDPLSFPQYPNYTGASAYMVPRYAGPLCYGAASNVNFSYAFVGIEDGANSHANVGFYRDLSTSLRWYADYTYINTSTPDTWFSPNSVESQVGIRHTFKMRHRASCDCMQAVIDTTVVANSFNDPMDRGIWANQGPWWPQFGARTSYSTTDVPGTSSQKVPITSIGVQLTNETVVAIPCAMYTNNTNTGRYALGASACDAITVWTANP